MRPIPDKIRREIDINPYYKICARDSDGGCNGRITMEHAFIYAGRQINELWSIIPLCWYHHLGPGLDKRKNQLIALRRATEEDLAKYPNKPWAQMLINLNKHHARYHT